MSYKEEAAVSTENLFLIWTNDVCNGVNKHF